ncbi:hypothetical protein P872_12210 [Rhodonellum psychrophilum GCM71 = DSM 17998]|uniref:Uncharacterized protein n=1 Tax=Rhodonellum psychrophilum GCM71 = DSM 17998 TaxID=1123057 RepID=U5BW73_9BACT|nr:hypothetical protein P872_12210 [Rhodonellum psychrophilum GCM71 = DSM 17998]
MTFTEVFNLKKTQTKSILSIADYPCNNFGIEECILFGKNNVPLKNPLDHNQKSFSLFEKAQKIILLGSRN